MGAVVAQVWQALTSFLLAVAAARLLGATGLGTFSLCLGVIVLATAVVSGMVGDSLVILDRHDRSVRGGLVGWTLILSAATMVGSAVVLGATGALTVPEAVVFGAALAAFVLESILRRVFMAGLFFWRLVLVDGAGLVLTLVVIVVAALTSHASLFSFFLALLVGQAVATVVGIVLLEPAERHLAPVNRHGLAVVARVGVWRGAQVSIPPLVLTGMRVVVIAAAGAAVLGQVEAARIFAAPALLVVQGFGSYLLSTYSRDKRLGLPALTRRATRAALALAGVAVLGAVALALLVPVLGPLLVGPAVGVDALAVLGWGLYVAGTATCQPFASLAAVHGQQVRVFLCRCVDGAVALGALSLLLLTTPSSVVWTPFVLAGGLFLGGVLVRLFALRPALRRVPDLHGVESVPEPAVAPSPVTELAEVRGGSAATREVRRAG